jgi:hypothetical protein
MVWSTGQDSFCDWENERGGKLKKLSGESG